MGRVQIFADGRDVTDHCTVGLRGADEQVLQIRPDGAGWIYASLPPGSAEIATVEYARKTHRPELEFHVAGDGRMTYFGHVRLELQLRPAIGSADAQNAVGEGMRAAGDSLAKTPNLSPGVAVGAAAAVTVVGAVALGLLSNREEAGVTKNDVEDKTYEAVAEYSTRYHKQPKDPSVSLAGSTFSGEPSLSPSVQRQGDLVYAEASLGGVRLTWLAVANHEPRSAAIRVQRFSRNDAPCSSVKLMLDGRSYAVAIASKTERASGAFKQTVQGELDLQGLRDIASAKRVVIDVCGTTRAFSALALAATSNFADAYQQLLASPSAPAAVESAIVGAPAQAGEQRAGSSAAVVSASTTVSEVAPRPAAAPVAP